MATVKVNIIPQSDHTSFLMLTLDCACSYRNSCILFPELSIYSNAVV